MKSGFALLLLPFFLLAFLPAALASETPQMSGPFDLLPSATDASPAGEDRPARKISLEGLGLELAFGETTTLELGYQDFASPLPEAEDRLTENILGKLGLRLTRMF